MSTEARIRCKIKKLKLPKSVKGVVWELGYDWDGDPALHVHVIVSDRTSNKARARNRRLRSGIREGLFDEEYYPYVLFRTESQQARIEASDCAQQWRCSRTGAELPRYIGKALCSLQEALAKKKMRAKISCERVKGLKLFRVRVVSRDFEKKSFKSYDICLNTLNTSLGSRSIHLISLSVLTPEEARRYL